MAIKQKARIDATVDREIYDAVKAAADAEGRSVAGMANWIFKNWRAQRLLAKAHEQANDTTD